MFNSNNLGIFKYKMSRLITKGNLSLFEYPECADPDFQLDNKGVLFIMGYKMQFAGMDIGVAKRFELGLKNYTVVGKYEDAKKRIINETPQDDWNDIIKNNFLDPENLLVLIKNDLQIK